jgi:hypothetical protein
VERRGSGKRAEHPGRRELLGDESVGTCRQERERPVRGPVELVEWTEALVDRVDLAVETRRREFGDREVDG